MKAQMLPRHVNKSLVMEGGQLEETAQRWFRDFQTENVDGNSVPRSGIKYKKKIFTSILV